MGFYGDLMVIYDDLMGCNRIKHPYMELYSDLMVISWLLINCSLCFEWGIVYTSFNQLFKWLAIAIDNWKNWRIAKQLMGSKGCPALHYAFQDVPPFNQPIWADVAPDRQSSCSKLPPNFHPLQLSAGSGLPPVGSTTQSFPGENGIYRLIEPGNGKSPLEQWWYLDVQLLG